MRSAMLKTAMLGAAFLLAAGTARAASLEVNVPFPFIVNHETFPAGRYQLEQDVLAGPSVMIIRGMHTPQVAIVATHEAAGHGPSKPALQFEHRENQYRLENIWESPTEGQSIIQHK
ncbi:MAG TPA: hypothetical protein VMS40_21770 [Vicinamibacterales bacterium]|nr:hypothetical protein [Vicinamibacterales bacterium]